MAQHIVSVEFPGNPAWTEHHGPFRTEQAAEVYLRQLATDTAIRIESRKSGDYVYSSVSYLAATLYDKNNTTRAVLEVKPLRRNQY